jgi:hypothetical protein
MGSLSHQETTITINGSGNTLPHTRTAVQAPLPSAIVRHLLLSQLHLAKFNQVFARNVLQLQSFTRTVDCISRARTSHSMHRLPLAVMGRAADTVPAQPYPTKNTYDRHAIEHI